MTTIRKRCHRIGPTQEKKLAGELLFYFIGNSEFWKHKKRTGVYRTYVR